MHRAGETGRTNRPEKPAERRKTMTFPKSTPPSASPSTSDVLAELARLRAENEALKASKANKLTLKVSDKGAVSVYGLGRFPVTLYKSQWEVLARAINGIMTFISENDGKLATK